MGLLLEFFYIAVTCQILGFLKVIYRINNIDTESQSQNESQG
jgi:hypothetical protein